MLIVKWLSFWCVLNIKFIYVYTYLYKHSDIIILNMNERYIWKRDIYRLDIDIRLVVKTTNSLFVGEIFIVCCKHDVYKSVFFYVYAW